MLATGHVKSGSVMKEIYQNAVAGLVVLGVGWICLTLVTVDKRTAIIELRVQENSNILHRMMKKEASHGNGSISNGETSKQAANEKEEPLRKAAWPPESYFTGVR